MRTVRVEKELWDRFLERAKTRERTASEVLRGAIYLYLADDEDAGALEEAADKWDTTPPPGRPADVSEDEAPEE